MCENDGKPETSGGPANEQMLMCEARLRATLGSIADEVCIVDAAGRIVLTNDAGIRCPGMPPTGSSQLEAMYPDGSPRPDDQAPLLRSLRGEILARECEIIRHPSTGELRHREVSSAPVRDSQGAIVGAVAIVRDVTEQRRVLLALEDSERKYRDLVENANSAILRWGRDGAITFFNEYAQRFFGYTEEEIIGQPVTILVPERDSTGTDLSGLTDRILYCPDQYQSNVNENVRRDGSRVWMAWANRPVLDADGSVREVLAVGTDITQLKEAEELVRTTLESILDGFLALDSEWRLVYLNNTAEVMLHIRRDDALGKLLWELFPDLLGTNVETNYRTAADGEATSFENFYKPLGRWFRVQCYPRQGGGISVYFQDITEWKFAEQEHERLMAELSRRASEMDTVFASVAEGLAIYDADGRLVRMNETLERMLAYPPEQRRLSTDERAASLQMTDQDGRRLMRDDLPTTKALRGETVRGQLVVAHSHTPPLWMSISAAPLRDAQGRVTGMVASFTDVTAMRAAQEREHRSRIEQMEFYRRMVLAATDGKLVITEPTEVYCVAGTPRYEWELRVVTDLAVIRHEIGSIARTEGMGEAQAMRFLVVTGEAMTNAIKHAGGGHVSIHSLSDGLMLVVSDCGPGIPALHIPDVALTKGYSTAGTLGMGYKYMISFADHVYLATGPEGTTVGVVMGFEATEPRPFLLPTTEEGGSPQERTD